MCFEVILSQAYKTIVTHSQVVGSVYEKIFQNSVQVHSLCGIVVAGAFLLAAETQMHSVESFYPL